MFTCNISGKMLKAILEKCCIWGLPRLIDEKAHLYISKGIKPTYLFPFPYIISRLYLHDLACLPIARLIPMLIGHAISVRNSYNCRFIFLHWGFHSSRVDSDVCLFDSHSGIVNVTNSLVVIFLAALKSGWLDHFAPFRFFKFMCILPLAWHWVKNRE